MEVTKTSRGFDLITFKDINGLDCSLQKSSLANMDAVWLGVDKDIIQEFRVDNKAGWENVDVNSIKHSPENDILIHRRIHLSQHTVKKLLPYLQHFAETGELTEE